MLRFLQLSMMLCVLTVGLLLWHPAEAATAPAGRMSEETAGHALEAYCSGHYDEAIALLKRVLASNPDNVNMRCYLADALVQENRLVEARAEYQHIFDEEPDSKAGVLSRKALALLDNHFNHWTVHQKMTIGLGDLDQQMSSHILTPTPEDVQKMLGNRVRLKGDPVEVTPDYLEKVKASIAKLPYPMVKRFLDADGEVLVVGSVLTQKTSAQSASLDADGLTTAEGKTVYVSVKGIDLDSPTLCVTLHEMGHSIDMLTGQQTGQYFGYSNSGRFLSLYQNPGVRAYLKSLRPNDDYFGSTPHEAFAEMFDQYFNGADSRNDLPPEVQQYFSDVVLPDYQ